MAAAASAVGPTAATDPTNVLRESTARRKRTRPIPTSPVSRSATGDVEDDELKNNGLTEYEADDERERAGPTGEQLLSEHGFDTPNRHVSSTKRPRRNEVPMDATSASVTAEPTHPSHTVPISDDSKEEAMYEKDADAPQRVDESVDGGGAPAGDADASVPETTASTSEITLFTDMVAGEERVILPTGHDCNLCLSELQTTVIDLVVDKFASVFLHGCAGSGKTTTLLLSYSRLATDKPQRNKALVFGAHDKVHMFPVALTMERFLQVGEPIYKLLENKDINNVAINLSKNESLRAELRVLNVLFIDDLQRISMKLWILLDKLLRDAKEDQTRAFGGVQVVAAADFGAYACSPKNTVLDAGMNWNLLFRHTFHTNHSFVYRTIMSFRAKLLDQIRNGFVADIMGYLRHSRRSESGRTARKTTTSTLSLSVASVHVSRLSDRSESDRVKFATFMERVPSMREFNAIACKDDRLCRWPPVVICPTPESAYYSRQQALHRAKMNPTSHIHSVVAECMSQSSRSIEEILVCQVVQLTPPIMMQYEVYIGQPVMFVVGIEKRPYRCGNYGVIREFDVLKKVIIVELVQWERDGTWSSQLVEVHDAVWTFGYEWGPTTANRNRIYLRNLPFIPADALSVTQFVNLSAPHVVINMCPIAYKDQIRDTRGNVDSKLVAQVRSRRTEHVRERALEGATLVSTDATSEEKKDTAFDHDAASLAGRSLYEEDVEDDVVGEEDMKYSGDDCIFPPGALYEIIGRSHPTCKFWIVGRCRSVHISIERSMYREYERRVSAMTRTDQLVGSMIRSPFPYASPRLGPNVMGLGRSGMLVSSASLVAGSGSAATSPSPLSSSSANDGRDSPSPGRQ